MPDPLTDTLPAPPESTAAPEVAPDPDAPDFAPEYHRAAHLLGAVWRATHPDDYRVKAFEIWRFFEENARAAATQSATLIAFFERIKARMGAQADTIGDVRGLLCLPEAEERTLLRVLRKETSTPILLLRLEQEQKKALKRK